MASLIENIEYARRNVSRTKTDLEIAKTIADDVRMQEMSYYLALAKYFELATKFFRQIASLNRPLSEEEEKLARILKFDQEHFQKSNDGSRLRDL